MFFLLHCTSSGLNYKIINLTTGVLAEGRDSCREIITYNLVFCQKSFYINNILYQNIWLFENIF